MRIGSDVHPARSGTVGIDDADPVATEIERPVVFTSASTTSAPPPGTEIEGVDRPRRRWRVVTSYRDANGRVHVVLRDTSSSDWRTLALDVVNDPARFTPVGTPDTFYG